MVQQLEADVRSITQQGGSLTAIVSPAKGSSYDVLRNSLETEQRRCESLNNDMVFQAEANDELVETLNTVKDANKRLLEQIRTQTAEISQLTQLRVNDEARIDQMNRKHEVDREAVRAETSRQVLAVREAGNERHNLVYQQLSDKLRYVKTRADLMREDTRRLQNDLQARQGEVVSLVDVMQAQMAGAERDLASQCSLPLKLHEKRMEAGREHICDLEVRLAAEQEARQAESLSWSLKHGALVTDRDGIEARMARDVTLLNTRLQATERHTSVERNGTEEERAGLERQLEDYPQQRSHRQVSLEQLQRDIVALETAQSAVLSENTGLEQSIIELRRHIRESDDALAAAVSGNEHLRELMEEQRLRFQDKNEVDLADCRASYEQKLADMRKTAEADAAMTGQQIEAMEQDMRLQDDDLERFRLQLEAILLDCTNFERDSATWKGQFDACSVSLDGADKMFQEEKHKFTHERLKLQTASDHNSAQIQAFEVEFQQLSDDLAETRREAVARETEHTTRIGSAEGNLKDLQEMLLDAQTRTREVLEQGKRVLAEDTHQRERSLDIQVILERNWESQTHLKEEENHKFGEILSDARRSSEQARSGFQHERDSTAGMLKRVQDQSRSKLAGAERERARIEGTCRIELSQAGQATAQLQRKAEGLERDLSRMQALLTESELNLTWMRQEIGREEREAALSNRQMEEEVRALMSNLEIVRRDEKSLTQQLETQRQRSDGERKTMQHAIDTAGRNKSASPTRQGSRPLTVR
jgi:hypothetical protein